MDGVRPRFQYSIRTPISCTFIPSQYETVPSMRPLKCIPSLQTPDDASPIYLSPIRHRARLPHNHIGRLSLPFGSSIPIRSSLRPNLDAFLNWPILPYGRGRRLQHALPTLAARAVMHDLVRKQITIDAEKALARAARVALALADATFARVFVGMGRAPGSGGLTSFAGARYGARVAFDGAWARWVPGVAGDGGKGREAAEADARRATDAFIGLALGGLDPADFDPVLEREQVVVAAGQVGGEDQREAAGRTRRGEGADLHARSVDKRDGGEERTHFAATPRTQVPAPRRLRVAGAEARDVRHCPAREAHHQQAVVRRGLLQARPACHRRRRGGGHDQFAVVLLVEGDRVRCRRVERGVGARNERLADSDFGRQANDCARDARLDQRADSLVDVAGVGGE